MQINDKAVLVRLAISQPGNVRTDKKITDEVRVQHALGKDSGRWLKELYPDAAFTPINKLVSRIRTWNNEQTLPWADEGTRILPTANHFKDTGEMRNFRAEFDALVESHFLSRLDFWVEQARTMHNGTFNASQYLSVERLRAKFGVRSEFMPIPTSNDFRIKLTADEMASISTDLDSRVDQAVKEAHAALWARLAEPIKHMAETLKDEKAKFKDSLVGNIREIVGLIPVLNLGDTTLDTFKDEVHATLAALDPDTLRDDMQKRADAAQKAQEIFARMSGYCPQ